MTGWESCRLGRVIRTHVSFSYRHPHGLICTVYVLGLCCGQAAFSSHYHSSHCSLMMRLHQPAFTQPLRCRRYENGIRRNNAKSLQAKKLRVGWESPTQALYWHPPERTLTHTHTHTHSQTYGKVHSISLGHTLKHTGRSEVGKTNLYIKYPSATWLFDIAWPVSGVWQVKHCYYCCSYWGLVVWSNLNIPKYTFKSLGSEYIF